MLNLFLNKLKNNKILYVMLAFILFITPSVMYRQVQSSSYAVVTNIGLDISDDKENELELTILYVVPKTASESHLSSSSVKCKNVADGLDKLAIQLGKTIGLSHCELIVFSTDLFSDDVLHYLDYFTRTNNLSSNSGLIATDNAKTLLEISIAETSRIPLSLRETLDYSRQYLFYSDTNIESFYVSYFSDNPIYFLPVLNVKQSSESTSSSGISSESSSQSSNATSSNASSSNASSSNSTKSSSQSSQSSSQGTSKNEVDNKGDFIIVKKGRIISQNHLDDLNILNIISEKTGHIDLTLENFDDDILHDSKIVLQSIRKYTTSTIGFENGKPYIYYKLNLLLILDEIISNYYILELMDASQSHIEGKMITAINDYIHSQFAKGIELMKSKNVDIFDVTNRFNTQMHRAFNEYTRHLASEDDLYEDLQIYCDVDIVGKI